MRVFSYECEEGEHRLVVSPKGRVRFLDYDAAHAARDTLRHLQGRGRSTCRVLQCTIRERWDRISATASVQDLVEEFRLKRQLRRELAPVPALPALDRVYAMRLGFLRGALSHELARGVGMPLTLARKIINAELKPASMQVAVYDGQYIDYAQFWRCRSWAFGRGAIRFKNTLGVVEGNDLQIPTCVHHGHWVHFLYIHCP